MTYVDTQRFIPTHVGTTDDLTARFGVVAVHPHACGDNVHRSHDVTLNEGSSPRMWGQRVKSTITLRTEAGSSPRMWGQLNMQICRCRANRFIPTHVGTTFSSSLFVTFV